jgi:hypothetical protein
MYVWRSALQSAPARRIELMQWFPRYSSSCRRLPFAGMFGIASILSFWILLTSAISFGQAGAADASVAPSDAQTTKFKPIKRFRMVRPVTA